jgi:hypothetical protein
VGFAVFLWGVQYKLSLYCSETTQRSIPAAKLLSESERPISITQIEKLLAANRPLSFATRNATHETSIGAMEAVRLPIPDASLGSRQQLYHAATCYLHSIQSNPRAPPIAV